MRGTIECNYEFQMFHNILRCLKIASQNDTCTENKNIKLYNNFQSISQMLQKQCLGVKH